MEDVLHRKYTRPDGLVASIDNLLPCLQKPRVLHHIRTRLYSLRLSDLNRLFEECSNNIEPIQSQICINYTLLLCTAQIIQASLYI